MAAVFTVALGRPSVETVSFDSATADGTAAAPGDYTATADRLEIAP